MQTIQGYSIEFDTLPVQSYIPSEINFNHLEQESIQKEINALLNKGAISEAVVEDDQFISNIFTRPKKGCDKIRVILNLKLLNKFVKYSHFKMENIGFVTELIIQDDWFCSIDLTDAYFSIPVTERHRKYLKFRWKNKLFCYNVLCFGLSSAPRVFTKCTKPILAHLREKGLRVSLYIDDMIIMNQSCVCLMSDVQYAIDCFQSLGFHVNFDKSQLCPTQSIYHLGFMLNSKSMDISLPIDKVKQVEKRILTFSNAKHTSVRDLAKLIGTFNAFSVGTKWGNLFYKKLEREKFLALGRCHDYDNMVTVSSEGKTEMSWWLSEERSIPKPILISKPVMTIFSDASLRGWGAHTNSCSTGGQWTKHEKANHINWLELKACMLALQSFANDLLSCTIHVKLDSVTAIAYLHKQGGMSKKLNQVAFEIWSWCKLRDIWLEPSFIEGTKNVIADHRSRVFHNPTEWCLQRQAFEDVCNIFEKPDIDLFASRLNHQVDRFCSWEPNPGCFHVDAFTLDWGSFKLGYAFPPFNLVGKVIQKMIFDKAELLLIAPYWTTQHWFPMALMFLVPGSQILEFKNSKKLVYLPFDESAVHGIWNRLRLCCFRLSGKKQ